MPEDIKDILKNADQEITLSLDVGAKLQDVVLNKQPLIDTIEQGAKASLKLTLISNIRNAVMKILKNHEETPNDLQQVLMGMIPLAMCQLNGEIDVQFTDFDEVKDHPMCEPLSINMEDALKQLGDEDSFNFVGFSDLS